jgi:hypothetical protein
MKYALYSRHFMPLSPYVNLLPQIRDTTACPRTRPSLQIILYILAQYSYISRVAMLVLRLCSNYLPMSLSAPSGSPLASNTSHLIHRILHIRIHPACAKICYLKPNSCTIVRPRYVPLSVLSSRLSSDRGRELPALFWRFQASHDGISGCMLGSTWMHRLYYSEKKNFRIWSGWLPVHPT